MLMAATVSGTVRGFLLPFARHFRSLGWRVDAIAQGIADCPECANAFDRVWDIDWSRNPLDPRNLVRPPQIVQELARREGYNLVHAHTPIAGFVTRYALRNLRTRGRLKVVYTAHGFHFHAQGRAWRNTVFLETERLAGRWTDYLIVINKEDQETADRQGLVAPGRVCYTPGIGFDTEGKFNPAHVSTEQVEHLWRELDVPPGMPLALMVAEFIPRKRHADLLRAFAVLLERREAYLALVGNGPLFDDMRMLAKELGIAERVRFLGVRWDVPALTKASTFTVLPSSQEGLPCCVAESLCMETPAVGANIRGVRELLSHGCGLTYPTGNVNALSEAMEWLIDNPESANEMGRTGRRKIRNHYALEDIIRAHEEIYEKALTEMDDREMVGGVRSWLSRLSG
jgi:glycosyltransferase involved in cell wall biosynthesis